MARGAQGDPEQQSCNVASIVDVVEQLSKVYKASGADKLKLEYEGMKLCLSKNDPQVLVGQAGLQAAAPAMVAAPAQAQDTDDAEDTVAGEEVDPSLTQVKAPLVGTFYAAPAPDADPFVTEGSRVNKGDVLCIVEAMKFMNEICAPCDGVVETIYASNEQPVSFDEIILDIRS